MKKFWPNRSEVKGFSIQNLARKYRSKISKLSFPVNEISNNTSDEDNVILMKEVDESISTSNLSTKKMHWANRDFAEYKKAA